MSTPIKTILSCSCALALASCASTSPIIGNNLDKKLDIVAGAQEPGKHDPIAKAAFWGTRYDRDPNNREYAVKFSKALRDMGSNAESLKVMSRMFEQFESDADIALEYGKSLLANDRAFEAVRPLEQAIAVTNEKDWRSYSAYGVALDKIGQHRMARKQYDKALQISPNEKAVLNNKGLSYALSGNLQKAETTLRYASAERTGTATVRQNLALVLAFKGEKSEAERLARSDLPPRIANNNVAYFQSLVSQPAYWQEFTGDNVDLPSFDEPDNTVEETFEMKPLPNIPAKKAPTKLAPVEEEEKKDPGVKVLSALTE